MKTHKVFFNNFYTSKEIINIYLLTEFTLQEGNY